MKIVKTIITILLFIVVVGLCTWVGLNYDALKSTFDGTKLYTQDEVTDAYNNGLTERATYEAEIYEWIAKYELEVNNNITARNQIIELNSNLDDYRQLNVETRAQIIELNNRINELESNITYYSQLLEVYQNMTNAVVVFMVNGEVYGDAVVVEKGKKLVELPDVQGIDSIEFQGWSLDGETIINPLDITINEDTRFIAVGQVKYRVVFTFDDGEVINTQMVKKGQNAISPNIIEKAHYEFKYWSIDGNEISINNYTINSDTTFVAIYELLPITDLTNTIWELNDVPSVIGVYSIKILYNNLEYSGTFCQAYNDTDYNIIIGDLMLQQRIRLVAVDNGVSTWTIPGQKTIKIIRGRDVTNVDFISWLHENATLIGFDD